MSEGLAWKEGKTIMDRLLTTEELATLLQKPKKFIWHHTHLGTLSHFKIGNELRFSQQHVNEFLKKRLRGWGTGATPYC